ncbi:MAG: hypothetical protein ACUVV0_09020 [Anaerolineae bacterium]
MSERTRVFFATAGMVALTITLLLGWAYVSHAQDPTRYVSGATGSDDSNCQTSTDPCQTIGYALGRAVAGDEILVAQGTYTENLSDPQQSYHPEQHGWGVQRRG